MLFFPKLLAGPILKYHEMKDQIAAPPAIEWSDFGSGFLRFARGMGRKLLIADPLGSFVNQIFSTDPAGARRRPRLARTRLFQLADLFRFCRLFRHGDRAGAAAGVSAEGEFQRALYRPVDDRVLAPLAHLADDLDRDYLYRPLGGNRCGDARTYLNLWICFLASGLWHGASWNFVLWGAYNGLFLTLDRLFLRDALARCGAVIATAVTLFIIMIGWAIFRSDSPAHLLGFVAALSGMSHAAASEIPAEVPFTLLIGALISLLPATPLIRR